jgi:aspartate/methionine/tyrosine aminotransferase
MLLQFSGLKGSKTEIGNKTLETDLDIAEFLKRETNIAMMPGQCCLLPEEEMILRLYLLKSKQELRAGFKKINTAVMKLRMLSQKVTVSSSIQIGSGKGNVR